MHHNFMHFSEKNCKKQARNHSWTLRAVDTDILQFNFKKSLDLDLKNLEIGSD